jgi:hypothetical protein
MGFAHNHSFGSMRLRRLCRESETVAAIAAVMRDKCLTHSVSNEVESPPSFTHVANSPHRV